MRKYLPDPTHKIQCEQIDLQPDGTFTEGPLQIVDRRLKTLRNKEIPLVKVLWRHHGEEEATWETESEIKKSYPHLFEGHFEDEIS